MTRKQEISVDYRRIKDGDFVTLATNVATGVEANPEYDKFTISVAQFRALITALINAIALLATRVHGAKAVRDVARTNLENALKEWSEEATDATPDRPDLWGIANFPLTKGQTSPRAHGGTGQNLRLTDGPDSTSIAAAIDRVPEVICYIWRIWPEATKPGRFGYLTLVTKEPFVVIDALDSRTAYCVQGCAWNNTGEPQFSDSATRVTQ